MSVNEEGEVSGHDDSGAVDDARRIEHENPAENEGAILHTHDEGLQSPVDGDSIGKRTGEIDQEITDDKIPEILGRDINELEAFMGYISSGPIPDPKTLKEYPAEVQRKIIDWHEREVKAAFDDESVRQDKLVDAQISQSLLAKWLSFGIDILVIGGALLAFVITNNPHVFWSYTLLGANAAANIFINVRNEKKGASKEKTPEKKQADEDKKNSVNLR